MNMNEQIINQIVDIIKNKQSFLIAAHVFPDGDSLGSVLALGTFLKEKLGKTVDMAQDGTVPPHYRFLPNQDQIKSKGQIGKKYDVVIVLECPDPKRVGNVLDDLDKGYTLLNIDHHQDNEIYGTVNLLDAKAAAVGELVFAIIQKLDETKLSKEIATCLYTAILTDTGGFTYSNTTGQTLRISADLLDHGADGWKIAKEVYHTKPLSLTQLMGKMMSSIATANHGKIAYAYVSKKMFKETGCEPGDTEGFIIPVRAVAGAEVAMLFQETNDGNVKLSIRSSGKQNVAVMAQKLGGGGHKMAAGAMIEGTLSSVMEPTLQKVSQWMES